MIPPHSSLVKYDNPVLVSTTTGGSKGGKKKTQAPQVDRQQASQTEDILNSILPPRYVTPFNKLHPALTCLSFDAARMVAAVTISDKMRQRGTLSLATS